MVQQQQLISNGNDPVIIKDIRTGSYVCDAGTHFFTDKDYKKAWQPDREYAEKFIKGKPHLKIIEILK